MNDPKPPLLVSSGELRPELVRLLQSEQLRARILLAAPGLVDPVVDHEAIARQPWARFSQNRASNSWRSLLDAFGASVDRLPMTSEWESALVRWQKGIDLGEINLHYWSTAPLFTRLISSADRTLVLPGVIHDRHEEAKHELQIELVGAEHERARLWFSERFEEAEDVSDQILSCLRQSWAGALITPEEAYFKVLAEYFSGVVHGLDMDVDDNPMVNHLTEFQKEAYEYAKNILRRFGGVVLADVVGLGKTYIATALLAHLNRSYGQSAVVVAPPKVLPAWQELSREFRVELATVSHGQLSDLDKYSDREILVIDESHNFRHQNTNRYKAISEWLRPGGEPSRRKVLLLSATPQNNDPSDVKHQLELFPDNYSKIPFPGESLDSWFKDVRAGKASLKSTLRHVVVRRTRGYIRQAYSDIVLQRRVAPGQYEPEPLRFPVRHSGPEQCLRYNISDAYSGRLYEEVLSTLARLKYPMHGLAEYVLEAHRDDPRLAGLRRAGRSPRGLFKVLLLKRLESSVHAFRETLKRLIERLEVAKAEWSSGTVTPIGRRAADVSDEDEGDEVENTTLPATLFEQRLGKDIIEDLSNIRAMAGRVADLGANEDAKLLRLKRYLNARPPSIHRTLIFTQFADTAKYLHQNLGEGFGRMALVVGGQGGVLKTIRRFAPRANGCDVPEADQIDLLVSTDVLSEGVNLQDADTIVNYDLHWNPVRLIQRAGRIDRIGSPNAEIHISSFLPETELEAGLRLEEVLRRRIAEFVRVFGEDSSILPGDERLDPSEMASAYTGDALTNDDKPDEDLDALSRHLDRLFKLRRDDPERYSAAVRLRLRRAAASDAEEPGIIATRMGWFWSFWRTSADGLKEVDVLQALQTFYEHARHEPAKVADSDRLAFLEKMEAARAEFEPMAKTIRAQRTHPRLTPAETFVLSSLESYRETCIETRRDLVTDLIAWVREGQAQVVVSRHGRTWKKQGYSGEMVFTEIRRLRAAIPRREEPLGDVEVVVGAFGRVTR